MTDPLYSLAWPVELFRWEAQRVLHLPESDVADAILLLIDEAFEDADVAATFARETGAGGGMWTTPVTSTVARSWLGDLLASPSRLRPYRAPVYYAERHGAHDPSLAVGRLTFAADFRGLLLELQDAGYFPNALPRDCVDDPVSDEFITERMQRATKLRIDWPLDASQAEALPEAASYTLVEYFNDEAQRPRQFWIHDYAQCGRHYRNYNRESGGVVYRWRANALLEAHGVPLRLASNGPERGRLVQHFGSGLDALADSMVSKVQDSPADEVAHAIRMYRERDAPLAQKRSALALLAGELEPKRKRIAAAVTKADESALFHLANQFAIRHRRQDQHEDYGEEFLDWMYWSFLAMADLMRRLDARDGRPGDQ